MTGAVHPGQLPGLEPCFWGSVNQWECDENDHLNVRFYAHKVGQALQALLGREAGAPETVLRDVRVHHIRFLRESRSAAPLRIDAAVLRADAEAVDVLTVMHHNVSGEPLAAFQTTLTRSGDWQPPATPTPGLPDFARPRGLDPRALPAPPVSREAALAQGFRVVGRGVIGAEECDAEGTLLPHVYIGRISDGMPNLWAFLNAEQEQAARDNGSLGGAALEQRLVVHDPLRRGAVFTQLSGVRSLGSKTQHMAHLLYDDRDGRLAASAEAVGVAMDLATRRAVPISPERRRRLEPLLLGA